MIRFGTVGKKERLEALDLGFQDGGQGVIKPVTVPAGGVSETPIDQIGGDETPEGLRSRRRVYR